MACDNLGNRGRLDRCGSVKVQFREGAEGGEGEVEGVPGWEEDYSAGN